MKSLELTSKQSIDNETQTESLISQKRLRSDEEILKIPNDSQYRRYAITFGEVAVLHIGGIELGKMKDKGFSVDELSEISKKLPGSELISLSDRLDPKDRKAHEAAVLLIRNAAGKFLNDEKAADQLLSEQDKIAYDRKYYDTRTKKTKNKLARYNIVFSEEEVKASEDFKQFSIKSFSDNPCLSKLRRSLPLFLGEKAENLNAEGNHYYHSKCGIGFHGDSERKIVIGLSLGSESTLRFCWRLPHSSRPYRAPIDLKVRHGDIYIMSEKATGNDWKKRSLLRCVHAAGHEKYISV